jgi:probable F420-dependent oxidoreductase
MMPTHLGQLGVWAHESDLNAPLARELEGLGYGAIWVGGSPGGELDIVTDLLRATESLVVATGIVNVWNSPAAHMAATHRRITAEFPDRFLLGIGIGHPEATSDYSHPYQALVDYLDVLDEAEIPSEQRVLAALGPKVLRLARDRTAGAHPYLVTPEHTRRAREILGPGPLLAPEQKVVIDPDPERAREIGRPRVAKPYLALGNYLANLRRLGWTDADFADGGSDELIDALVAHGDAAAVAARVREHLEAGADHVPVQLLAAPGADPLPAYRALAEQLL